MSGSLTLNNVTIGLTLSNVQVDDLELDLDELFQELDVKDVAEYYDLDDLLPHYDADDILKELNLRELTDYDALIEKLGDEMDVSEAWDFCKSLMEHFADKKQTGLDVIKQSIEEQTDNA